MSSLNDLLNPDGIRRSEERPSSGTSPSKTPSPPVEDQPPPRRENYYQSNITIRPHDPHENCPDALDCLPDTNGRPQHTLPVILRCAILGSPKKRLTIREIYSAMERKYPYYLTAGPAWKQSVRHHLSLNRLFERQPRPATEPGFGSYWTVNLEAPPGTKRPRKRGVRKDQEAETIPIPEPPVSPAESRRQRRRERNALSPAPYPPPMTTLRPVDAHSFSTPAVRNGRDFAEDDGEQTCHEDQDGSDDDFGSDDEQLNIRYDPRMNMAASSSSLTLASVNYPPPPKAGLHGAFSGYPYQHIDSPPPLPDVKRLAQEVDRLRKQSSEAMAHSYRISAQLNEAKAETAKVRAAMKVMESRLEDEKRRRIEAELAADEESKRRRETEDALRLLQSLPYAHTRMPKHR
ncbi:hypothetical protein K474DRAFT_1480736 [Panus rudis PR-1116 ss-1]|nr:hypothetical protein K474DRAFT_1480736 [Panus rudis PR-1116 ss-1]